GLRIGIVRTTIKLCPPPAKSPRIQRDLRKASTPPSREHGSVCTGEAHFSARINTVRVTSRAVAARERRTPGPIILGFAVSGTLSRKQGELPTRIFAKPEYQVPYCWR